MRVLVTGGTGYIGSHTAVSLMEAGHDVVLWDNLSNSRVAVVSRMAAIVGTRPAFVLGDVRDAAALDRLLGEQAFDAVIHFAGLKAVGESVRKPLLYYENNVQGTITLLRALDRAGVRTFVFSSSATVYGDPARVPIREDFPRAATNAYGRSKIMIEDVLADLAAADPRWRIARLRYFNPVGAHESGLLGEDPQDVPNNLMPYICQVAVGRREALHIFGGDYETPDGTGVRDYIHVADLASGHVAALRYLHTHAGMLTVNLGTGRGYSVLEMVEAFRRACGRPIPYKLVARRPGDVAQCYADPSAADAFLQWRATYDLDAMCRDAWRWQKRNPTGYEE
ncbi:UDP-glucose 4-epimerase GalE [Acidiferrobacter thiooxydans]|uniref:UDP-glucose 4-epimerase n=1 Tax=Acidiferrobacter thiooxydans TaxID=163359 RepID=A0A368HD42_9GAMM|nr:UDP-glucose 4-epimerase GalE [Acidiferrobacter thiooxydans]RCN56288.1 UDP-glucose 4-epimerase GalE [Acidiferrobacter thiooxydans]